MRFPSTARAGRSRARACYRGGVLYERLEVRSGGDHRLRKRLNSTPWSRCLPPNRAAHHAAAAPASNDAAVRKARSTPAFRAFSAAVFTAASVWRTSRRSPRQPQEYEQLHRGMLLHRHWLPAYPTATAYRPRTLRDRSRLPTLALREFVGLGPGTAFRPLLCSASPGQHATCKRGSRAKGPAGHHHSRELERIPLLVRVVSELAERVLCRGCPHRALHLFTSAGLARVETRDGHSRRNRTLS